MTSKWNPWNADFAVADLEAQRQAYALFYQNQAKQGKENGARFPNEEIPKKFVELRGFISPLGSRYGPLNAKQTRDREYYERILNGENDPQEAEEVAEWERRSLAEYEENSRSSRKKKKKTRATGDESSGPTFIKLGQWASTRRDIFSKGFCDRMSILHTKTRKQRHFRDCDAVLDEVFGEGFAKNHKNDVFVQIEPYSIGSGCIAQVYKATVNVPALERATGRKFPQLEGNVEREIAIKIMPSLGYLEPLAALAQFEMVLRRQVDLRNEARALQKFSKNFDHKKTGIKFPIVIGYTKNAIIETFEHGMYINRLVAEENDPQVSIFAVGYVDQIIPPLVMLIN
ncbi:ABC1 family protein [Ancylostoma caninum]|uniref:ABC1 family protein n=1 Tax=Ancylostoma caninum TaxID=29170 RepID=A0A368FXR3_ANCCA|nr:ABC1 family protein [Ancylostoma caninum]